MDFFAVSSLLHKVIADSLFLNTYTHAPPPQPPTQSSLFVVPYNWTVMV